MSEGELIISVAVVVLFGVVSFILGYQRGRAR